MNTQRSFKILVFSFFTLLGSVLQAQDYTWSSSDKMVSLTAVPAYDPETNLLTTVVVTLSDYTIGAAAKPPTEKPYTYPPPSFTFLFKPSSADSKEQIVKKVKDNSTVNGTMKFRSLKSSSTSTFLFINLTYGVETIQTRSVQGSVIQIPLSNK